MHTAPATDRHVDQTETRLDLTVLEKGVQRYFENGLAAGTRRTYQAGINKFIKFCNSYNVSSPLPVSVSVLYSYISHLANSGLSYSTIKTYLSAIRYLQIANDFLEPRVVPMPKLNLVERGIHHVRSEQPNSKQRLPIAPSILQKLQALWSWEAADYDVIMTWAAYCTAFSVFFRIE